jgi:ketosteroid isomerase-like protein
MKKWIFSLLLLCSIQHVQAQTNLPQKSPKASVGFRVGLTDVSVLYSAPAARGRNIWGGIVPYGKVWRAGANNATNVSFSTAVILEGKKLAAGTYSFFLIPNETQRWTAVFNTDPKQWGAYIYSEAKDAARVSVRVVELKDHVERLSYSIEDHSLEEGQISLAWGNKKITVPFRVEVIPVALAQYDSLISKAGPEQKWYLQAEASDLLLEAGKLREAQKYLDESLKNGEHVWNLWKKAQWQAKSGDYKGAFTTSEKIRSLAKAGDKDEKSVYGNLELDLLATEKRWQAAQDEILAAQNAQRNINHDIWTPFAEAYASNDADKYLALHTKDFIRANGDDKSSDDLTGYRDHIERSFARSSREGGRTTIEFRFFERIASANTASERGIYKYSYFPKEGDPNIGYGKFHVVLRKEAGVWKIVMDYDSSEGGKVGEVDFNAAMAVDDFSKY